MEYRRLGNSGLRVSRLALGCMSFGDTSRGFSEWSLGDEEAQPFFQQAVELGITFWDTANVYAIGSSEEIVGRALKKYASRDDIVLATKVHFPMHEGPGGSGLSRKAIMEQIDASLARLDTDYVDLYQIHRFDPNTPVEETMEALHDVVKAGKARYIGASSMWAWQFSKMQYTADLHGWTRFVSMQNQYNLMQREEEREMFGLLADQGVGSIPYAPLAKGRLARPWGEHSQALRCRPHRPPVRHRERQTHRRGGPKGRRSSRYPDGARRAGVGAEEPGGDRSHRWADQATPSPRLGCSAGRPAH